MDRIKETGSDSTNSYGFVYQCHNCSALASITNNFDVKTLTPVELPQESSIAQVAYPTTTDIPHNYQKKNSTVTINPRSPQQYAHSSTSPSRRTKTCTSTSCLTFNIRHKLKQLLQKFRFAIGRNKQVKKHAVEMSSEYHISDKMEEDFTRTRHELASGLNDSPNDDGLLHRSEPWGYRTGYSDRLTSTRINQSYGQSTDGTDLQNTSFDSPSTLTSAELPARPFSMMTIQPRTSSENLHLDTQMSGMSMPFPTGLHATPRQPPEYSGSGFPLSSYPYLSHPVSNENNPLQPPYPLNQHVGGLTYHQWENEYDELNQPTSIVTRSHSAVEPLTGRYRHDVLPRPPQSIAELLRDKFKEVSKRMYRQISGSMNAQDLFLIHEDWVAFMLRCLRALQSCLEGRSLGTGRDTFAFLMVAHISAATLEPESYRQHGSEFVKRAEELFSAHPSIEHRENFVRLAREFFPRGDSIDRSRSFANNHIQGNSSTVGLLDSVPFTGPTEHAGPSTEPYIGVLCGTLSDNTSHKNCLAFQFCLRFLLLITSENSHWASEVEPPVSPVNNYPGNFFAGGTTTQGYCESVFLRENILKRLKEVWEFKDAPFPNIITEAESRFQNGGTVAHVERALQECAHKQYLMHNRPFDGVFWKFITVAGEYCRAHDFFDAGIEYEKCIQAVKTLAVYFQELPLHERLFHRPTATNSLRAPARPLTSHRAVPATRQLPRVRTPRRTSGNYSDEYQTLTCDYDPCDASFNGKYAQGNKNRHTRWTHERRSQKLGQLYCEYCEKHFVRPDNARKHEKTCSLRPTEAITETTTRRRSPRS